MPVDVKGNMYVNIPMPLDVKGKFSLTSRSTRTGLKGPKRIENQTGVIYLFIKRGLIAGVSANSEGSPNSECIPMLM